MVARNEQKIQPRGLYAKVATILGCANRLTTGNAKPDGLVEAIISARSPAFMYFKHHRRLGSQLVPCSEALIRERVGLCGHLRFLDETSWGLTRQGQHALQPGRFEAVVVAQTTRFLQEKGYDLSQIDHRVQASTASLWLPTSAALYEVGDQGLRLPEFRRLLGLLAECGYFRVVQSRIYLPSAAQFDAAQKGAR
jgi:hypothetical protein